MTVTVSALRDISHITPIACPACKIGKASLTERLEGNDHERTSEIWVFKCDNCAAVSVQPVER
jgi:hypothetical protein